MDSDQWRQSAVLVAAVGQTLFIVIYGFMRAWWHDYVGRALFFKSATLAVFLDTASVYILLKRNGYDTDLVAILYWLVALACWVQLIALIRIRHDYRLRGKKRDERIQDLGREARSDRSTD